MIDTTPIPNLSIILPGICDVGCTFCTWRAGATADVPVHDRYLARVEHILNTMPDHFISISLTGGEPLLSPYLWPVLDLIDKSRWRRVGITTNATQLTTDIIDKFSEKLNFINISRHHYDDAVNQTVFASDLVPTTDQLTILNSHAYSVGIPVSYNCVLTKYLPANTDEIEKFVKYAFKTHARSINFRKIQGPTTGTEHSKHELLYLDDPTYINYPCPVCRTADTYVRGMRISWKSAVLDPSINLGYWFEAVLHPNGILSGDWDGTMMGEPNELRIIDDIYSNDDDVEITLTKSELRNLVAEILYE